ncbi:MAG: triose-phosphate isomerase, partial [Pseudomonadota bacterium]
QNIYPEANGAFTGETSPQVMKDLGAKYVLIGHSERRTLFGETDAMVNEKVKACKEFGLAPVICIGETLEQRKAGATLEVLTDQIKKAFKDYQLNSELHLAYEPVWAIGTGEVATAEQVGEAHRHIRALLAELFGDSNQSIQILYGGSVKPGNAEELSKVDEVGGFLVGGASLKTDSFLGILGALG